MRITRVFLLVGLLPAAACHEAFVDKPPEQLDAEFHVNGQVLSVVDSPFIRRFGPITGPGCIESFRIQATLEDWTLDVLVTESGTLGDPAQPYGWRGPDRFSASRARTVNLSPMIIDVEFVEPVLCQDELACSSFGDNARLIVRGPDLGTDFVQVGPSPIHDIDSELKVCTGNL